jgi:hypothetical protein
MNPSERRVFRSEVPQVAVGLFLEAIVARNSLKAVALANEDGFLVAGIGGGYDLDWLAALGPVCSGDRAKTGAIATLVENVTGGQGLFASAVEVGGSTLYLTSIGAQIARQSEAAATLQRILVS